MIPGGWRDDHSFLWRKPVGQDDQTRSFGGVAVYFEGSALEIELGPGLSRLRNGDIGLALMLVRLSDELSLRASLGWDMQASGSAVRKVKVAAPAESRTPNWHRAKIAHKECGWMATEAARLERRDSEEKRKTDLTLTGLLMEGLSLPLLGPIAGGKAIYQQLGGGL